MIKEQNIINTRMSLSDISIDINTIADQV